MSIDTLSNQQRVEKLQKSLSSTNIYDADLNVAKLGTNRISEIRAKIGDNGQPFEQLYNNYLNSL